MKISQLFKDTDKTVFSFEVFPPKKDSPIESVYSKLEEICSLKPDFISVTYGAGGTVGHSRTAEIASKIKNDFGVESVAHLTCVNSTKSDIDANLDDFVQCGIENILALRGDYVSGVEPKKEFVYASDLCSYIKILILREPAIPRFTLKQKTRWKMFLTLKIRLKPERNIL